MVAAVNVFLELTKWLAGVCSNSYWNVGKFMLLLLLYPYFW